MSEPIYVIACTEADMALVSPPYPHLAADGSCAHPSFDPLGYCRLCAIEMTEAAVEHREQAWMDSL